MAGHQRTAGRRALHYGWACMPIRYVWGGEGGYGGSPNAEAGKTYQQNGNFYYFVIFFRWGMAVSLTKRPHNGRFASETRRFQK
jgi:hypothetical protein